LTFAILFLNPDGTIYGRYGTRSSQQDAEHDISLEGLKQAMEGALALHSRYPLNKDSLRGKRKNLMGVSQPEEFPSLARYKPQLDYQGAVAQSCMHCHQIRDAQRRQVRESGRPMPDELLYPYPKPDVLGLVLDVDERATVKSVADGSAAAKDGFQVGDEIVLLAGQPMLSIADVQWALHSTPEPKEQPATIPAQIRRDGKLVSLDLTLNPGWRRASDFAWRTTSWDLRRMAGGMKLDELADEDRAKRGFADDELALLVRHVGQYGEHQNAKRAGIQKDDVLTAFDGLTDRMTEAELLAYVVQQCKPGQKVPVTLRRGGTTVEVTLTLQ
jgi:predicted metalloprotease with PDZ domain